MKGNQTATTESDRKWRENMRETYALKRDFAEKNGCNFCDYKKDCEYRKNLKKGCDYATNKRCEK